MDIMSSNLPDQSPLGSYTEKLTIETPEQTLLEFGIAGIGSRFLALALDTLIQILIGFIVGLGGTMALGALAAALPKSAVWGAALLVIFFFLLYFGYFAFFDWHCERTSYEGEQATRRFGCRLFGCARSFV